MPKEFPKYAFDDRDPKGTRRKKYRKPRKGDVVRITKVTTKPDALTAQEFDTAHDLRVDNQDAKTTRVVTGKKHLHKKSPGRNPRINNL